MKVIIISLLIVLTSNALSQLEKSNWIFGQKAWLKMSSTGSVPVLQNAYTYQVEGTSTYSDKNGNLVLYTDGITVYNKDFEIIDNGTQLFGDTTSTQSALIVPKTCSENEFYIFTTTFELGLRYSIVDMNLNNNKGRVVKKNIPIWSDSGSEKIAAILHANERDYWIVTTGWPKKDVRAYLLTCDGIDTLNYSVGYHQVNMPNITWAGQLMPSLQGDKIAFALSNNNAFVVMDFDNTTGISSNPIQLKGLPANLSYSFSNYGVCFSPDGKVLYATGPNQMLSMGPMGIVQFDLTQPNQIAIEQSAQWIANTGAIGLYPKAISLQYGLDGKIYCSYSYYNSIHVINNPNVLGLGCNFEQGGAPLYPNFSVQSRLGLPAFPNKYANCYVRSNTFCTGDTTFFDFFYPNSVASVHWDFGETASANNTLTTLYNSAQTYHVYSQPGVYTVNATIFLNNGDTVYSQSCVTIHQNTINNYPTDTNFCLGSTVTLQSGSSQQFIWKNDTVSSIDFTTPGNYTYQLVNMCRTDTLEIEITNNNCEIPNVFTPNQDGQNDFILFPHTTDDWMCTIYNRWGVKMITLNKDYPAWRGDENEHFNEGIYYYVYSSSTMQKSGYIYLVK